MAKLILSMDGLVLKEYTLTKERTTIGRKPHNDIQIDNLAVSGEHAVVVTILSDSFLEDLGSTNGTLVNGQQIKKHFLQHNDVVELGKYKLKYINEAPAASKAADFEKTMVLRPGALKPPAPAPAPAHAPAPTHGPAHAQVQAQAPAPAPAPAPAAAAAQASAAAAPKSFGDTVVKPAGPMPAAGSAVQQPARPQPAPAPKIVGVLQILSGAIAGRELELTKPLTTLGKPGVQVAVITRRPQGYFITHVEGSNFPVVNGKTLDAQAHALNDHDIIELAGVKMEFFIKT